MFKRALTAIVLVLIPALATAQRAGGGFGGGGRRAAETDWNSLKGGSGGFDLANKDLENLSPIKLLIDKRKDLKLTDDQLNKLKDVEGKAKEKNDPLYRVLDSLRREAKIPPGNPSDDQKTAAKRAEDDRARGTAAKREALNVVKEIRGNYDASLKDVIAAFDESQQKTANDLLGKQREEAEKLIGEKLGGGRR